MKPFVSVTQALSAHRRWRESLAAAGAGRLAPRLDGSRTARREDLLAVFLSVDLCLQVLSPEEGTFLETVLAEPGARLEPSRAREYHRLMTKLGKEMRRRGVVAPAEA